VEVLATLDRGPAPVTLRRAVGDDLTAIVGLLAADQLGATRDGISTAGDLLAYRRAFEAIDGDPAHILVVAQAGDDIAATMQLSFIPRARPPWRAPLLPSAWLHRLPRGAETGPMSLRRPTRSSRAGNSIQTGRSSRP